MKRKYYLLVLFFLMSLGSCKKYLDTAPTDFLNPRNYYDTESQLMFARASAYHTLTDGRLWRSAALYLMNWYADEGYMNRTSLAIGPWNYNYSSTEPFTNQLWTNLYDGINRANVVLANVDKNTAIPQAKRDVIRGEMLFLRGYYYFILVQYFGGVPLKTDPTTSVIDVDIPRASVKEIYMQILKDMEVAEPLVPGIATIGFGGAVSKSAVRGLLARVNLNMAGEPLKDKTRYAQASKWAKMVIDDAGAGHALNPSYPQIFMNLAGDKYDIKEVIWEAESRGNGFDAYEPETSVLGYIMGAGPGTLNPLTGRSDAYLNITRKFYDVFEPGDNRKWFSIAHFTYDPAGPSGSKTMTGVPTTDALKNGLFPAKFRREYETFLPKNPVRTPQNFPLLRYSDILLMYAEAENEINGPTVAAIEAVNQVRRRGWSNGVKTIAVTNGGSGYTTPPTVTFSSGAAGSSGTAAGTATISGGAVTAITLNRDLAGIKFFQEGEYDTAPTVTISGGGSGATASVAIYKKTDANLTAAQSSSKAALLATIQDERMRELNFEMLRKSDLLRWGTFLAVNQEVGNQLAIDAPGLTPLVPIIKYFTNVTARDLLMPIPVNETTLNKAIVQNPGW